jgi:hypothetical protein
MKKYITIIISVLSSITAFAQTDIKSFDKIGPNAVLNKLYSLGFYQEVDEIENYIYWEESDDGIYLEHSKGEYLNPMVSLADESYDLIGFETTSNVFLFLTDYLPGGIKVGDPITKPLGIEFSKTRYGRGKVKNNCHLSRKTSSGKDVYIIFEEELYHVSLTVKNGIIDSIVFIRRHDEPYDNYDYSNTIF